jgi:hypothetical protein
MNFENYLNENCFPEVDRARSLQAKINGKWFNVFSFILTNATVKGREKLGLKEWPEFDQVCAEITASYPNAKIGGFRITSTKSIIPYASIMLELNQAFKPLVNDFYGKKMI